MDISTARKQVENNKNNNLKIIIKNNLRSFVKPQKFRAYCVGTAKSGTHSVSAIFEKNYRASHEPEGAQLIYLKHLLNNSVMVSAILGQRS